MILTELNNSSINERFSSLPCASHPEIISKLSLLKKCEIGSREVDCNKMFTKVTTDGGMCCSFNMKDIFRNSQYSELVRDLQTSDQNDSGSHINHFYCLNTLCVLRFFAAADRE